MSEIFLFILLGLAQGALIAGVALGVVLVHRGSGTINMATGAIAAWGAYVFYGLRTGGSLVLPPLPFVPHHLGLGAQWSTWPAVLVALAYCAALGVLFELLVQRPLRRSAPLAKLLASLGVFLLLQAVIVLRFGSDGQSVPAVLPSNVVRLFGDAVPTSRLWLTAIVVAVAIVLTIVYRHTTFGLATRAASEDETKAMLAGLSPNRLSMINIVVAFVLVGALGILVAPVTVLDPVVIPFTIVPALGAALLARFTSFAVAAAAGIGMGIIQSLLILAQSKSWFPTTSGEMITGVDDLVFFLVIVAAMYWRGASLPERGQLEERRLPSAPAATRMMAPGALGLALLVVAFLVLPFDWRQAAANGLIGVIVCLSLVVVTGFIGQISLVQVGLSGVAGFAISKLAVNAGIGFPLGPIIGIGAALIVGLLVAASALRVRGVNLAIVTVAAAVALEQFGFSNPTWGGGANGSPVNQPHVFSLDLGTNAGFFGSHTLPSPVFGLVCSVCVVACCLLVAALRRSGLGHRMLAVRSNERAAAAAGIDVQRVKLVAFAISSVLAGVAGALYAYNFGSVSGDRFGVAISLSFIAFAYVGGITTVQGALLAGTSVTGSILNLVLNDKIGVPAEYQGLLAGLALVGIIILKPEGLASNTGVDAPPVLLYRWARRRYTARDPRSAAT